jgi:hypothetical protein
MLKNLNRIVKSLLCIYAVQLLLVSCIEDDCKCRPRQTYETKVTDFDLKALDTSGFTASEINGTVFKNSFGIVLNVAYNVERIAKVESKNSMSQFGFSAAYACSCVPNEFISLNKIDSIKITVTDSETQIATDVTENFKAFIYGNELNLTDFSHLHEDFQDYWNPFDVIELELNSQNNIPNTAVFTIELILSEDENLIKESEVINFV